MSRPQGILQGKHLVSVLVRSSSEGGKGGVWSMVERLGEMQDESMNISVRELLSAAQRGSKALMQSSRPFSTSTVIGGEGRRFQGDLAKGKEKQLSLHGGEPKNQRRIVKLSPFF